MKNCIIIAGGDSLRTFNFQNLKNKKRNIWPIFAINESFIELTKIGITPEHWVFWDEAIRNRRIDIMNEYANISTLHTIDRYNLKKWREWAIDELPELSRKENHIGNMNSTLAMAINVAIQLGFETIYLLGVDNKVGEYLHWYEKEKVCQNKKEHYTEAFNLFDRFGKAIKKGLKENEQVIQVEGGLCFENISYEDFKKVLRNSKARGNDKGI